MDLPELPQGAPRRLLLAYSGGRDSTALLHRLAAWCVPRRVALRAVHVDHGLHADSARWAEHCRASAQALGIGCRVRRVSVSLTGQGLEAAARRARYAAFAEERAADECLVLAHHRDDQAETVLLALLRGSGERGLAAMGAFSDDRRGPIWRPLLETPGAAIEAYARAHGLDWIDDPSNADLRLSRNALRHTVLPMLRRHWPQADAALARSAGHLAEADALLAQQAQADLAGLLGLTGDSLDAAALRTLPAARASRALRAWADTRGARLGRDAVARVFGDWARHPPGRALRHAVGDRTLWQWSGRLWLEPHASRNDTTPPGPAWEGRTPLALPHGGWLHLLGAAALPEPLRCLPRAEAPSRFRRAGAAHSTPLQALFAGWGVPPWRRDTVPLLVDATGDLVAIADLAYAGPLDAWLRAHRARLLWQPRAADG